MQLHDLTGTATTHRRATPPKNESNEVKIALTCNDAPRRAGPQRSRRCPVMERCLDWALESGQDYGVWGGTNEEDRRRIQRRAARLRLKQQKAAA